jgi:hypothetical protein
VSFYGDARFDGAKFRGDVSFSGAHFHADARFDGAKFRGNVSFIANFHEAARIYLDQAAFRGDLELPPNAPVVSAEGATVDGRRQVELPRGWRVESPGQPISRLLPPEAES